MATFFSKGTKSCILSCREATKDLRPGCGVPLCKVQAYDGAATFVLSEFLLYARNSICYVTSNRPQDSARQASFTVGPSSRSTAPEQ